MPGGFRPNVFQPEEFRLVTTRSLRDELLAIPGIAAADLEGDADTPAGVRVRLESGADPDVVGEEVQRVLATHGMNSHVTGPKVEPAAPPPPPGAAAVVPLPGIVTDPQPAAVPGAAEGGEPAEGPAVSEAASAREQSAVASASGSLEEVPPPHITDVPSRPAPSAASGVALEGVSITEGRTGISVTAVASNGRSTTRRARSTEAGLDEAIVTAVSELVDPQQAAPLLVAVFEHDLSDTALITVLLEVGGGERRVGTAVLDGGRGYALAKATWQALAELV